MTMYTNLKKLAFFAVAGLLALSSCNKKNNTDDDSSLEANSILVAEATTSADAVYAVNAITLGCSKDTTTANDLPASISTYLTANYSGYTYLKTLKARKSSTVDSYIVVIKYNDKPIALKFDANGNFVQVLEQRERGQLRGRGWKQGGRFDGRDGKCRDTIALSSLPAAIKAYFLVTYPKDTLLAAHTGRGGDIVVISANNGLFATAFTSGSVFVKRVSLAVLAGRKYAISQVELSAKIATYLATTYPGYVFHRAYAVKINSTTQAYVVFIDSNDTKYGLHFDANGNLIKTIAIR